MATGYARAYAAAFSSRNDGPDRRLVLRRLPPGDAICAGERRPHASIVLRDHVAIETTVRCSAIGALRIAIERVRSDAQDAGVSTVAVAPPDQTRVPADEEMRPELRDQVETHSHRDVLRLHIGRGRRAGVARPGEHRHRDAGQGKGRKHREQRRRDAPSTTNARRSGRRVQQRPRLRPHRAKATPGTREPKLRFLAEASSERAVGGRPGFVPTHRPPNTRPRRSMPRVVLSSEHAAKRWHERRTYICNECVHLCMGSLEEAPTEPWTTEGQLSFVASETLQMVPRELCERHNVLPISRTGTSLIVAMADPTNQLAKGELKLATGYTIEPVIATERALRTAIDRHYPRGS